MDSSNVPVALQERLGAEATARLLRLFEVERTEWTQDVISRSVERFEQRLVGELAGVRTEMARGEARLREEIASVRVEMARGEARLHGEISQTRAMLREEMAQQGTLIRQEIATNRFELLKWSFLFCVGQVIAVVGLVGVMLRAIGPGR
jgi:hypothetical protein